MAKLLLGSKAIPFMLPGVDEEEYSLADFVDKEILVLVFSDNDCSDVRGWEDRLMSIQADYAGRGVQLIAINANAPQASPEASLAAMQARAGEKRFNFLYLYDETQEVARFYGAERIPEVFVFDKRRILQYHGAIDDKPEDPEAVQTPYLRDALDAILAGRTPAIPETAPPGCAISWK